MDAVKSWAMTVCLAALAAGMAGIIAPKGKMEKVFQFTISLFFLCCVLVPVFKLTKTSFQLNLSSSISGQSTDFQKTVNEQKILQAQENINSLIREICVKRGVTPLSVSTGVTLDKSGAINIGETAITLKKADLSRKDELITAVKNELGLTATIKEGEKV